MTGTDAEVKDTKTTAAEPAAKPSSQRGRRVDAAHEMATESRAQSVAEARLDALVPALPAEDAASTADSADDSPTRLIQQVRSQAEQLAGHLRSQQKELDHREAHLNAREAQVEQQVRSARLWLQERQAELRGRQEAFEEQQSRVEVDRQELDTRLEGLQLEQQGLEEAHRGLEHARASSRKLSPDQQQQFAHQQSELERQQQAMRQKVEGWRAAQTQLAQRQQALSALQQMLSQRELELAKREKEIADQAAQNARNGRAGSDKAASENRLRRQQLDEAEGLLTDALNELEASRKKLLADRKHADGQARQERQRLADWHRTSTLEIQRKREAVQRRGEQLDTREKALEQMRTDLTALHRETLEMRLAVEETWSQLGGLAAPAAVTQTLSRIRARLSDRYRLEIEELSAQREQLESLGARVNEQFEKLAHQKREFQQWSLRQQDETERHAARISAREREIQIDAARCEELQQKWQAERRHYQGEVRRLLAELRKREAVTA